MKLDRFLEEYPMLIASNEGEAEFGAIRMLCTGLSTPKLGKVLNRACRFLEPNEVYCEIGTFTGYTLISASLCNSDRRFYGIDNFRLLGEQTTEDKREWVRNRLKLNLDHFKFGNQHVIDSDFRNVDLKETIGVFYIDGHHTREEVYENFKWGHQRLANKALILIDDISIAQVGEGVEDWVKDHPGEYREIFRMHSFYDPSDINHYNSVFWNGLSIVTFERGRQ